MYLPKSLVRTRSRAWQLSKLYGLNIKLVSTIFDQFFSTRWQPFKSYEKCFLFHLKSPFCSRDIQVFVFPSSHLFLLVSHCGRGCLKRNLIVYDVINCLNKNFITHFVWYLGKEERYDIETLCIYRVLNQWYFYGKIIQKMCTKS